MKMPKAWTISIPGDGKRMYVGPVELDYDDVDHREVKGIAKEVALTPVWPVVLRALFDTYLEENGGDMPTNDGHPAFMVRDLLAKVRA